LFYELLAHQNFDAAVAAASRPFAIFPILFIPARSWVLGYFGA